MTALESHNKEVIERLTRVETRLEAFEARFDPLADDLAELVEGNRQRRGFVSGVAWTVSTIWLGVGGALALAWEFLRTH